MSIKRVLNYKFQEKDERDYKFSYHYSIPEETLPIKKDLRHNDIPILDQGSYGTCTMNAGACALYFCMLKEKFKGIFHPSRMFMYDNVRIMNGTLLSEDTGASLRDTCKSIDKYRTVGEDKFAYNDYNFHHKPSDALYKLALSHSDFKYLALSQNLNELKSCINSGFPFICGISVYDSFMTQATADTGIVPMPDLTKENELGGHALIVLAFDDTKKVFILQNSWGTGWGGSFGMNTRGFLTLPYDYIMNTDMAGDFWSIRYFT